MVSRQPRREGRDHSGGDDVGDVRSESIFDSLNGADKRNFEAALRKK
jgi:hypothetical protein